MVAPLDGVRVIDCSLFGPGARTMHLADLGAEVIKVEPPGGDPLRHGANHRRGIAVEIAQADAAAATDWLRSETWRLGR